MQAVSGRNAPTLETAILSVLLEAETARHGARLLLDALEPMLDDRAAALAARDRDGSSIHVLAERAEPFDWPDRLEPHVAGGMHPGVDRASGVLAVPLRARGRVVGYILLGDPSAASDVLHHPDASAVFETCAAVLHAMLMRLDAEQRRQAAASRALDTIADSLAHQIANPLAGASAIAELLSDDIADEGQRAAVLQIRHELGRAFTVISDALDFHRDTHAQDGVQDLSAVVERVTRFRGYAIREQGIALQVEAASEFLPVRGDLRALEHALQIVLRSAEERAGATVSRRIDIRIGARAPGECFVDVTDSGPGVLPDLVPRFLDLPLAGDAPARAVAAVPDLGLAQSILRGIGGRLEMRASKLEGTALTLVLPQSARHTPARGTAA